MTVGSPNSEVLGNTTGAVPLVSVNLANKRDEQPTVHTILDPLNNKPLRTTPAATQASTQAATGPAEADMSKAAPPVPSDEIKIVVQQKATDVIKISRDNEANADVWIISSSGIGSVTLERTGEAWPAEVRVHLRYDADRAFGNLEGFTASELTAAATKVALKTTVDKSAGKAEISIPGFSRAKQIQIEWVDAYR
jgi:hypothetical protein